MMLFHLLTKTQTLSLTVLLNFFIVLAVQPSQTLAVPLSDPPRRYCSSQLTEAIANICEGRFNSIALQFPSSVGGAYYRPSILRRLLPDDGIIFRPTFGGPIHECCKKPCTYEDLESYCSPE